MTDNIYRRPNANSNISVEGLEIDMLLAGDVNAKVSKPKWSSAYEISRQKAMQSSSYIEDKGMEIPKPSLKMIIGILLLIFAGSVMFITGSVLYWASVPGQKHTGFDVMIIGGVMLIPGGYGGLLLFGAWMGWKGYGYHLLMVD